MRRWILAFGAMVALAALSSCRHRSRPTPSGPTAVTRNGRIDPEATARAQAMERALGGRCRPRIALSAREGGAGSEGTASISRDDALVIARACVARVASLEGDGAWARAEPFASGLVEALVVDAMEDDARRTALHAVAREELARGGSIETSITQWGEAHAADSIDPGDVDDLSRVALAYALVVHLAARDGVGLAGVARLAHEASRLGIDAALELPPVHTDAQTLLSVARADVLSVHAPRAPELVSLELQTRSSQATQATQATADVVVAQFDLPLRARPSTALVCGVPTRGVLEGTGDALDLAVDLSRCTEIDGVRRVDVVIAPTMGGAPQGLDGAIVHKTFAGVDEAPPALPDVAAP